MTPAVSAAEKDFQPIKYVHFFRKTFFTMKNEKSFIELILRIAGLARILKLAGE